MRWLGAMVIMGAAAVALIAVEHSERVSPAWRLASDHLQYAGNLVFWALLVIAVRTAVGLDTSRAARAVLVAAPLAAYAAGAVVTSRPPRFIWMLPVGTMATAYVCARVARSGLLQATDIESTLLTRMIVCAAAVNAAQAIRTFWPQVDALREIVPITMTAGFLSIAALAMRGLVSASRRAGAPPEPRYAKSALDLAGAERLLAALDRGMQDHHWYRDPALSLPALAARLDTRPHALSQALNQVRGRSLTEYLAVWRVAEARRLLTDPASDRYTIDALAEASGFASRSAFYKAFKAREGMTPTVFRAQARGESR
jgi:AraC-like DNA-binding protein